MRRWRVDAAPAFRDGARPRASTAWRRSTRTSRGRWRGSAIRRRGRGDPGFATLLRIMVAQQLSTRSAAAIWARVEAACLPSVTAESFLALDAEAFKAIGFSRQKMAYGRGSPRRSPAARSISRRWRACPRRRRSRRSRRCRGFGRWSAEIYLLFALGRADIFPADDLGLQIGMQRLKRLAARPTRKVDGRARGALAAVARLRGDLPLALLRQRHARRGRGGRAALDRRRSRSQDRQHAWEEHRAEVRHRKEAAGRRDGPWPGDGRGRRARGSGQGDRSGDRGRRRCDHDQLRRDQALPRAADRPRADRCCGSTAARASIARTGSGTPSGASCTRSTTRASSASTASARWCSWARRSRPRRSRSPPRSRASA